MDDNKKRLEEEIESLENKVRQQDETLKSLQGELNRKTKIIEDELKKILQMGHSDDKFVIQVAEIYLKALKTQTENGYRGDNDVIKMAKEILLIQQLCDKYRAALVGD